MKVKVDRNEQSLRLSEAAYTEVEEAIECMSIGDVLCVEIPEAEVAGELTREEASFIFKGLGGHQVGKFAPEERWRTAPRMTGCVLAWALRQIREVNKRTV